MTDIFTESFFLTLAKNVDFETWYFCEFGLPSASDFTRIQPSFMHSPNDFEKIVFLQIWPLFCCFLRIRPSFIYSANSFGMILILRIWPFSLQPARRHECFSTPRERSQYTCKSQNPLLFISMGVSCKL